MVYILNVKIDTIFCYRKILVYFCPRNMLIPPWLLLFLLHVHFFNVNSFLFWQYLFYLKRSSLFSFTFFRCWKSSYCRFGFDHSLKVVSMSILIILLIFSTLLTFVFNNNAKIFDSARINSFCLCRHLWLFKIFLNRFNQIT